ncbi:tetratricopeptide repeat protein [Nostoc sp. FACHB-152]|uniref:tetratricopeptide repeat protein n=1 Tax=unclassified Nostoc TaxID=2593658 RepID=UPI0016889273|nr:MULTISPECIES: tetratricopeptide repeat protein [unclassified Nostoc]MBD2450768.1 tetratricopeptide repeat protein [Nostoc sp. FACHB-152]MBD2470207.1 tetratricopeptide repeat protein [Nostoc sp. FACHB-145]
MDWITLLRSLQSDFIKRLASGCLLHCETEGQHSELTIISGERLKILRDFCWQMAEKYKRVSPVRDVFISYLKGKLGEEVVKERLADCITEVDYEKRFGGDGKIDFTLTTDPTIGIEVKSRHGSIDRVRWSVSSEEVEKNAVIVCIFIQEEVHEAQSEYHLFLAGFLPTRMIKLKTGRIAFGIDQLLYAGGLRCYLEQYQSAINYNISKEEKYKPSPTNNVQIIKAPVEANNNIYTYIQEVNFLNQGHECFQKCEYQAAITNYSQALKSQSNDAEIYYKRGLSYYHLGDYEEAIADYSQAIQININDAKLYLNRGLARYQIGNYELSIEDYTQAIRLNPNFAVAYKNRADARSHLGDNQGAIEDYTQAIKINPNYVATYKNRGMARYFLGYQPGFTQAIKINPRDAVAYKNRGNARADIGDHEGAIEDYTQSIEINPHYADAYYNRGNAFYDLGNLERSLTDYTQALQINSNFADAYYNRANILAEIGDKPGAIEDFQKAANIYLKEGKLEALKDARQRILDLQIEESLDILNF